MLTWEYNYLCSHLNDKAEKEGWEREAQTNSASCVERRFMHKPGVCFLHRVWISEINLFGAPFTEIELAETDCTTNFVKRQILITKDRNLGSMDHAAMFRDLPQSENVVNTTPTWTKTSLIPFVSPDNRRSMTLEGSLHVICTKLIPLWFPLEYLPPFF